MKARRRWRWMAIAFLVVAGGLGGAAWYAVGCEGKWAGEPLEARRPAELSRMEGEIREDVRFLAVEIGERNLRDDTRHRALTRAGEWIRGRLEALGYRVAEQPLVVAGRQVSNLEIEIPGRKAPSQIVIVSAQHDTLPGSPGANNNASGEAVLLQLAALLRDATPDRTIRLVSFTTEEDPWFGTPDMGSFHYARRSRERGEDIRAMMSLDSIGYYLHEPGSQRLPIPFSWIYPDRGDFLAFIGNLRLRGAVTTATRGFHKGSGFPIEAGLSPEWVEGATWSDHASFWKYGYPAIQVTDTGGFRSPFHTGPGDTPEKLDHRALARIALGMYGSVLELSTLEP
jgi:Zn-dependent M28 family amino/carboxypeptidase